MKKLLIVLFFFSLALGNAFSKEAVTVEVKTERAAPESIFKNEGYLSVGTISAIGLFGGMFSSIADSISDTDDEGGPFEAFSIGLGYNLFLWEHLGLGGFLNFERMGSLNLVSAQAKLTAQYGFKHFKIYHSASAGVMFINDNGISPVFDITVIGFKLDWDDFNIFVEGSFPSTAFLKAGASYYF